jgi:hypothetical protein
VPPPRTAGARGPEQRIEVEQAEFILWPQTDRIAVIGQLLEERHRAARAPAVQQRPRHAALGRGGDHRQDRGDADAAGDEHEPLGLDKLEVVPRAAHSHLHAGMQVIVNVGRAPAPGRLAQHPDPPRRPVPGITAEGVLAGERRRQQQVDVGAGGPRRERLAGGVPETECDDAGGRGDPLVDDAVPLDDQGGLEQIRS